MSEFGSTSPGEKQPVVQETVSIADGPVDFYIADTRLQIVNPWRDLERAVAKGLSSRINCFVIDPEQYDVEKHAGFKALRDGEEITLGRGHTYNRFNFGDFVSGTHVGLSRDGDNVEITDLDSTNGTFLIRPRSRTTPTLEATPTLSGTSDGTPEAKKAKPAVFIVAGESVPADYRHSAPNEDAFFTDAENRTLGVFDGMGGHEGSAQASALAAASVERSLQAVPLVVPHSLAELAIKEALEEAHEVILRDGAPDIGTTALVAKVFESESGEPFATIGSAGDSRAYLMRGGHIEHVTLDHVFAGGNTAERRNLQDTLAQFTDLSELTPQQRQSFSMRNMISSCLGAGNDRPTISVNHLPIIPGDQLLLTSDGIHDNLTNTEIEEAVQGADTDVAVHDLIAEARKRSRDQSHARAKADDMTALMLTYES